jgi:phosphomannomutase
MSRIVFGTDGWRGIIADDFTFDNVKAVAQALADYLISKDKAKRGLVIGYDTRFLSDKFAQTVADVAASNSIRVFLADKPTATPIVSFTVKNKNMGGGVVITASHNPFLYNGIKFKLEHGGPAPTEITKQIEGFLHKTQPKHDENKIQMNIEKVNFETEYVSRIKKLINLQSIIDAGFRIVFDAMHGAGNQFIERLLCSEGCKVITIRGKPDPTFGGVKPEPIAQNLQPLMDEVTKQRADVGLATDGDADRVGLVTAQGEFVAPHEVFALLLIHLFRNRGWRGGVVKTASVCNIISQIAEKFRLPLYETAVGFKNVCEIMLTQDILIGGEESSGFGFKNHVPERDGILAGLFILEMIKMERKNLDQLLSELRSEFGELHYDRIDLSYEKSDRMGLIPRLQLHPPNKINGLRVEKVKTYVGVECVNGIKFYLSDARSWLLMRASETEPIIRIYSESKSDEKVKQLLNEGLKLLQT